MDLISLQQHHHIVLVLSDIQSRNDSIKSSLAWMKRFDSKSAV